MNSFLKILPLVIVLNGGALLAPQTASAQVSVNFQLFYDELSPYGMWVDYQNYGYVWIPDVDRQFSPYGSDGHWIFTEDGWMWVSDYSWGWAPFHYGRWDYDDSYGWLWVPNNEWGPAWVTWRRSSGYYGWAPMRPGISIEFSFGSGYRVPNDRWIFVSDRYLASPDINRYYVDRSTNVTIINTSTVINNTYVDNSRNTKYVAGPAREDVQKVTNMAITPIAVREISKPGQVVGSDQLQIYRPRVQATVNGDSKPAPSKVVSLKEVKPVAERKPRNQPKNENLPASPREQSTPPSNVSPPVKKEAAEQPRVADPSEKKMGGQERQPAKPADEMQRGRQPRVMNPPEKSKNIEEAPRPQTAKPTEQDVRGRQPRVATPPEKDMNMKEVPRPQTAKPTEQDVRGRQPQVVNPPDKELMKMKDAPKPPPGKSPEQMVRERQPRSVNPADTVKSVNQQSKPSGKMQPPPVIKGKARDAQPPKTNKQKRDSVDHQTQIPLRKL
jgi:hypothetical protein